MNIGMLWFDNSKSLLSCKLEKAIDFYQEKYGKTPTAFYVNPSTAIDSDCKGLNIQISKSIMPNHIWLGVERKDGNNT